MERQTTIVSSIQVAQGGTTVWENYISYDEEQHPKICSMNHYSPGAVCAFLFRTVCGIQVDGENHFRIIPTPGGSLTYADAVYQSPYGKVESGWKREKDRDIFTVAVPANTTAQICLPDGRCYEVGYGKYEF